MYILYIPERDETLIVAEEDIIAKPGRIDPKTVESNGHDDPIVSEEEIVQFYYDAPLKYEKIDEAIQVEDIRSFPEYDKEPDIPEQTESEPEESKEDKSPEITNTAPIDISTDIEDLETKVREKEIQLERIARCLTEQGNLYNRQEAAELQQKTEPTLIEPVFSDRVEPMTKVQYSEMTTEEKLNNLEQRIFDLADKVAKLTGKDPAKREDLSNMPPEAKLKELKHRMEDIGKEIDALERTVVKEFEKKAQDKPYDMIDTISKSPEILTLKDMPDIYKSLEKGMCDKNEKWADKDEAWQQAQIRTMIINKNASVIKFLPDLTEREAMNAVSRDYRAITDVPNDLRTQKVGRAALEGNQSIKAEVIEEMMKISPDQQITITPIQEPEPEPKTETPKEEKQKDRSNDDLER